MFIELVDVLRCADAHPDGHLVAAPSKMADRRIVDGLLGCPACNRRYQVVDGVMMMCDLPALTAAADIAPVVAAIAASSKSSAARSGTGGVGAAPVDDTRATPAALDVESAAALVCAAEEVSPRAAEAVSAVVEAAVVDGQPVTAAELPGAVLAEVATTSPAELSAPPHDDDEAEAVREGFVPAAEATALHIAAWLGLEEPGGFVVLAGGWAEKAEALAGLAGVHVVALDGAVAVAPSDGVSVVQACGYVPFGGDVLRGVAVDAVACGTPTAADRWLTRAALALRPGARLLAPAACSLPAGMREVASDELWWIAEREAATTTSEPVTIRRVAGSAMRAS